MSCEEELNALRQAEWELAAFRKRHPDIGSGGGGAGSGGDGGTGTIPQPGPDVIEPAESGPEVLQRIAELTAAVRQKQAAYDRCRGRTEMEALMRDETGAPLGGGAGPPM